MEIIYKTPSGYEGTAEELNEQYYDDARCNWEEKDVLYLLATGIISFPDDPHFPELLCQARNVSEALLCYYIYDSILPDAEVH